MKNIVVRKAKKDYVCEVCGHLIHSGEEYLDSVILNNGTVVRHERYHDECPKPEEPFALLDLLVKNNGEVLASLLEHDTKIKIVGLVYKDYEPFVVFTLWGEDKRLLMPLDYYKTKVNIEQE